MSVEKRFRRCVDLSQRCLTLDDTHDLCVMCLGEEHPRSVLEGMECVHCEHFLLTMTRVNCGRKMYCLLHLLIQQEVLCWLMVCF